MHDDERPKGEWTDTQAQALGWAMRDLWVSWEADADENGAYHGSAADQCSDVYEVLCAHGLAVR